MGRDMKHLSFEDMERYLAEDDSTEEYLCWLEPVMEHLAVCGECAVKVSRLMLFSEILDEEAFAFSLVGKEQEVRRKYVAAKLELMAMSHLARRLRQGEVLQYMLQAEQLKRAKTVMRGDKEGKDSAAKRDMVTSYVDGKLIVEVQCEEQSDVTVILSFTETEKEPVIAKALWLPEKKMAVAEFVITEVGDEQTANLYEIYVNIE